MCSPWLGWRDSVSKVSAVEVPGPIVPDEAKFRELILYVAKALKDDPSFGATKLNKVLFYAEFAHMRATGRPISGVEFQRLPQGPAPRRLLPVRGDLIAEGRARMDDVTYLGYVQHRLIALDEPDTSIFDEDEMLAIEQAVRALLPLNGGGVSLLSHQEVGWSMVEDGDTIPYETAFLRKPVVTETVRARIAQLAEHQF